MWQFPNLFVQVDDENLTIFSCTFKQSFRITKRHDTDNFAVIFFCWAFVDFLCENIIGKLQSDQSYDSSLIIAVFFFFHFCVKSLSAMTVYALSYLIENRHFRLPFMLWKSSCSKWTYLRQRFILFLFCKKVLNLNNSCWPS